MKSLLLVFLILVFSTSWGQSFIEGRVLDSDSVAISARITISTVNPARILKFTNSDNNGNFKITLPDLKDSLVLEIRKMSYATVRIPFIGKLISPTIILERTNQELEEIVIKAPPIRKFGDTLVYKVSEFSNLSDQSIGDVISRLPGIEVNSNGQILYQGKPINRYYVNNLNLLDARYGLVNNNLAHEKVVSVEILENHQPIRVLDSLNFSERAALNIKLKNNITQTTTLKAGLGLQPLLWDANITPMVFFPNLQFIGSVQSNNTGDRIGNQIRVTTSELDNISNLSILKIKSPITPPLSSQWWLNNTSHLGSLNALKKLNNYKEIKANIQLLLDQNNQQGGNAVTYNIQGENVAYAETQNNKLENNIFLAEVEVLNNSPKKYFQNKLSINNDWQNQNGLSARPGINYNQTLKNNQFSVANHFQQWIKINKQIHQLRSRIQYLESNENLKVHISGADTTNTPIQDLKLKKFTSTHTIGYNRKLTERWDFSITPTLSFNHHQMFSELNNSPIKKDTINEIKWTEFEKNTQVFLNYKDIKWRISARNGFIYQWINYNMLPNFHRWNLNPNILFNYSVSDQMNFSLSTNLTKKYSPFGELHNGFIMSDYLTITQRDGNFREVKTLSSIIGFNYKNVIEAFNLSASYRLSHTTQNLISQNHINSDGSFIISNLPIENIQKSHSIAGNLNKHFLDSKSIITLTTLYSRNIGERLINDKISSYTFSHTNPSISISNHKLKYIDGAYKFNYIFSKNISSRFSSVQQQVSLGLNPVKSHRFEFKMEHYKLSTNNIQFLLINALYQFNIPKSKQKLELIFHNITNRKQYHTLHLTDYYQSQSYYQLRPRQVMIRTRMSL